MLTLVDPRLLGGLDLGELVLSAALEDCIFPFGRLLQHNMYVNYVHSLSILARIDWYDPVLVPGVAERELRLHAEVQLAGFIGDGGPAERDRVVLDREVLKHSRGALSVQHVLLKSRNSVLADNRLVSVDIQGDFPRILHSDASGSDHGRRSQGILVDVLKDGPLSGHHFDFVGVATKVFRLKLHLGEPVGRRRRGVVHLGVRRGKRCILARHFGLKRKFS